MRSVAALATFLLLSGALCCLGASVVACGSAPAHTAHDEEHDHDHEDDSEAGADHHDAHDDAGSSSPAPVVTTTLAAPERTRPRSTASYEEAMSSPEPVDIHDERQQLTDGQLTGPMRGTLNGCKVPGSARITIRTAVQLGRAIGVTVNVRFERKQNSRGRPVRPLTRSEAKAEAKLIAKIASCVDKNVRDIVWPPSRRRDSFTVNF